jgi:hypothetical protein
MSENWQLYAQQGVNGTEYGIRIRPGYIVVGFQKEDAEEIIRLHDEVERLRSQSVEQVFRRSKGLLPQSHPRARGGDEECGCKT